MSTIPAVPALTCLGQLQQSRAPEQLRYSNSAAAAGCLASSVPRFPAGNENKGSSTSAAVLVQDVTSSAAASSAGAVVVAPLPTISIHLNNAFDDDHRLLHPPVLSTTSLNTSSATSPSCTALPQDKMSSEQNMYSELWHACAGPLVSLPRVGSRVVYFPQGHLEQVAASLKQQGGDMRPIPAYDHVPSQILCRVADLSLHADRETDEVFAQFTLVPLQQEREKAIEPEIPAPPKMATHMFCKTLTISDTSTHGGFSVPRRAADECFPPLDYSQQRPSQEIVARDLHGVDWKFRHIYRGQPRRHLLTTGWSLFVSSKKLVAGDSVLFLRRENGELWVGIRRGWRTLANCNGPMSVLPSHSMHMGVLAAAAHAVSTKSMFNVYYNPRTSPSEFVISHQKYRKAFSHTLSVGMRFKMRFEAEDGNERRYTGTIVGIGDIDHARWQNSKWRSLKVNWDEQTSTTAGGCNNNHVLRSRSENVSPWEIEPFLATADLDIPIAPGLKRYWSSCTFPPSIDFEFGVRYASAVSNQYGAANYTKYLGRGTAIPPRTGDDTSAMSSVRLSRIWQQQDKNKFGPSPVRDEVVKLNSKVSSEALSDVMFESVAPRDPHFSDLKRLRLTDQNNAAIITSGSLSLGNKDGCGYIRNCGSSSTSVMASAESLGSASMLSASGVASTTTTTAVSATHTLVLGQKQQPYGHPVKDAAPQPAAGQGILLNTTQQQRRNINENCVIMMEAAEASSSPAANAPFLHYCSTKKVHDKENMMNLQEHRTADESHSLQSVWAAAERRESSASGLELSLRGVEHDVASNYDNKSGCCSSGQRKRAAPEQMMICATAMDMDSAGKPKTVVDDGHSAASTVLDEDGRRRNPAAALRALHNNNNYSGIHSSSSSSSGTRDGISSASPVPPPETTTIMTDLVLNSSSQSRCPLPPPPLPLPVDYSCPVANNYHRPTTPPSILSKEEAAADRAGQSRHHPSEEADDLKLFGFWLRQDRSVIGGMEPIGGGESTSRLANAAEGFMFMKPSNPKLRSTAAPLFTLECGLEMGKIDGESELAAATGQAAAGGEGSHHHPYYSSSCSGYQQQQQQHVEESNGASFLDGPPRIKASTRSTVDSVVTSSSPAGSRRPADEPATSVGAPAAAQYRKNHQHHQNNNIDNAVVDSHMQTPLSRNRVKVLKKGHPVGRSLDLSAMAGYVDLRMALEKLFGMGAGELSEETAAGLAASKAAWQITYTDKEGDVMLVGDDPWADFVEVAVKICIESKTTATTREEEEERLSQKSSEDSSSPAAMGGGRLRRRSCSINMIDNN